MCFDEKRLLIFEPIGDVVKGQGPQAQSLFLITAGFWTMALFTQFSDGANA